MDIDMTKNKIIEITPTEISDAPVKELCSSLMGTESVKDKLRKVLESGRQSDAIFPGKSGTHVQQEMNQIETNELKQVRNNYEVTTSAL